MDDTQLRNDIIQAALSGKPVEMQQLFNRGVNMRVNDRVDELRPEVAKSYFVTQDDTNADNDE